MRFTFILIITTIFLWSNSLFSQSSIEVNIDLLELHKWLENAPSEQAISITHQFSVITLPNEKGESIDFLAFDSPILSPQLQEQFPSIKTYRIEGIDFPSYYGRITVSDFGASAMIYSDNGRYLIRPKASNNAHEVLLAPFEAQKIHLEGRQDIVLLNKTHTHEEKNIEHNHEDHMGLRVFTSSQGMSNRRVVDVFITADYEYYVANGNNNSAVMTAITNQINSVNMIYQRDLNVRLALSNVAFFANDADDNAYFAGPSNAVPEHIDNALNYFDAVVLSDVAGDNITGAVTLNSFDLGFYFSGKTDAANASGAGAALSAHEAGILCDDDAWDGSNVVSNDGMIGGNLAPLKGGAGASAGGAAFASQTWIDVVAHEMGHAFGALHTWTSNQESCTSDQFDTPQSYELGSGSTLMSYLGICGDENAGNEPDDNIMVAMSEDNAYFHIGSIFHIDNYLNGAAGTLNCITTEANGNSNVPAIQIPAANATASIPANTPFALTGTATDADNDMLTYNWEQVDQANAAFNFSFAAANSTTSAPLIRSRQPSTEATRYIPILNDLATGGDANMAHPYELLPTSSANGRMLDFQFSARDQKGGLVSRTVKLTVDTNIPELDVTSQNTSGISYNGLSTQTITWTNGGGGCTNVKILLSTDGGLTFPIELAASTANDGTEDVMIPDNMTTTARVMVICDNANCVDPFNINMTNFEIGTPLPVELLAFDGWEENGYHHLKWKTASEIDNQGFEIQRSSDAKSWEKIDFVKGAGTSLQEHTYNWSEKYLSKSNVYYRLKQIDFDGAFEFSSIINISKKTSIEEIQIIPNPNDGVFTISYQTLQYQKVSVELISMNGSVVHEQLLDEVQSNIELTNLDAGVYFLRLRADNEVFMKRLVIQ